MNHQKLVLLNSSILTAFGTYVYRSLTLEEAKALVREFQRTGKMVESAIGHESTAEFLSQLLEFPVPVNRVEFRQATDALALIFKLKERPPAGVILSREELDRMGYEFGLLERIR